MMVASARNLLREERDRGGRVLRWHWNGYRGFAGELLSYGERTDGVIVRAHGTAAAHDWRTFVRLADNIPRLDIQVTAQLPAERRDLIDRAEQQCLAHQQGKSRQPEVRCLRKGARGETLYIGSPKSDVMARLYDKHAQSPNEYQPGAYRYEVQYRRLESQSLAKTLLGAGVPPVAIAGIVHTHYATRGVPPAFPRGSATEEHSTTQRRSHDATRLAWLADTVAPAVRSLLRRVPREEVFKALGLLPEEASRL
jgi:hypothetical protein